MSIHIDPYLETLSGERIAVRTIYCIGRNYAEHAQEMNAPIPTEPIVFIKPASAIVHDGGTITPPRKDNLLHHEVEVVAVIGSPLHRAPLEQARDAIIGYAVGVDLTLRDVQQHAKANGLPWACAKGFATSTPISRVVPATAIVEFENVDFGIAVNGTIRQRATPQQMLWSVPQLVAYLSHWFVLLPGDLVMTGTPPGVGPLVDGDELVAWLGNFVTLRARVQQPAD